MAVNKTTIRIVVEGAPSAKQQLENVKKATDSVTKAQKGYNNSGRRMRGVTTGLRRQIGALRNSMLLYSFAIGSTVAILNKLVNIYRVQIESETKLTRGMKNIASATEGASDRLIDLASALQKTTTFGDEEIISAQAMLSTFQLNERAIAELTPRILDMAAATGQDLQSAAIMVGKAFTGQASAMSRAGVIVDEFGLKSARANGPVEEFAFLAGELDKNFGGFAEALAKTDLGKLDQLRNELGDIQEDMGKKGLPALVALNKGLLFVANTASESVIYWGAYRKAVKDGAEKPFVDAKKALDEYRQSLEESSQATTASEGPRAQTLLTTKQQLDLLKQELGLRQALQTKLDEQITFSTTMTDTELEGLVNKNELETQYHNARLEASIAQQEIDVAGQQVTAQQQEAFVRARMKEIDLEQKISQAKAKSTSTMLGSFAALNEAAGGNALFGARLAQSAAIIDMFAGANKAFAQGGVLGFVTSASIIAAGTANVLNIEKQIGQMKKAATGADFVTDGPQVLMVGEAGRERVSVTPLEGPNIAGPQQSPVNINISGNVLSQDFVMEDVLPKIEEAVRVNLA